ncbi:MAG: sulfite exporter TauE/SafE family protein [Planctomycetota bacterium]|nr:sulfite exporter TauE/SafE family protein [Planctomycetota bacterium]
MSDLDLPPDVVPDKRPFLEPETDLTGRGMMLFFTGLAIAFVGAMCGIGGGLFAVPLLHFGFRMHLRRAVATSLCLVFATASAATIAEVLSGESEIHWGKVGFMTIGVLLGAQAGFPISKRFDTRQLRGVFSVVIFVAALRILFAGSDGPMVAAPPGWWPNLYAGLAGFAAGFVSPILGIGGGLVMVPALLLGPSALGFAAVRACSMAAAAVTSLRSLSMYWKEGSIHHIAAPFLAAGALVGASLGVTMVHMPGVIDYARQLLGLVLIFVSYRFATAWWKGRE